MKRKNLFLIGLLSLMLAFSFTACGGAGDNSTSDTGNSTVEDSVGESDNTTDDSSSNDNSSGDSSNDDSSNDSSSSGDSSNDSSSDDSSSDSSSGGDSSNDSSGDDSSSDSSSGDDSSDVQTKTWTVTFDCGAWTTIADVQVEDGETISMPKLPESASYQFIKWTLNGETFDFSTPITGDITLVLVYGTYGDIV